MSVCLTTPKPAYASAVERASDAMDVFMATSDRPIRAMESVALDPLPELDEFAGRR